MKPLVESPRVKNQRGANLCEQNPHARNLVVRGPRVRGSLSSEPLHARKAFVEWRE